MRHEQHLIELDLILSVDISIMFQQDHNTVIETSDTASQMKRSVPELRGIVYSSSFNQQIGQQLGILECEVDHRSTELKPFYHHRTDSWDWERPYLCDSHQRHDQWVIQQYHMLLPNTPSVKASDHSIVIRIMEYRWEMILPRRQCGGFLYTVPSKSSPNSTCLKQHIHLHQEYLSRSSQLNKISQWNYSKGIIDSNSI